MDSHMDYVYSPAQTSLDENRNPFFKFITRSGPLHPGSKKIPEGSENCLDVSYLPVLGENLYWLIRCVGIHRRDT